MEHTQPYNEKALLHQLAKGSEEAFTAIFHHYRGKLYHYIFTITSSREMAEDTVHDVFLKVWTHREKLANIENMNAYLYRVCHNQAIGGLRRMAKETLILAELQQEDIPLLPNVDPAGQREIRNSIQEAVSKLSPQQRKIFLLSRQDGLKHKQIAEQLGVSINTIKTHLGQALRFLREEIGQQYKLQATAIWVMFQLT
ncbi:RNA polymerase sigma-70 factor [Agriterribacter sp.]|uniref:RNA polymerase sigma factor n=1 Tax=Agriterribacter sp. TaxID=2821509 RepID=UPI002C777C2A|nr:RNA polymerase sigma-70 factor [Agriterribacter sp.]HRO45242.1 RNA polymerase sigma-70 factor [Agriterribacter sp.]HRQ16845.1 RNA polymerase sigma-70 factor [Agriterribacter sp.]